MQAIVEELLNLSPTPENQDRKLNFLIAAHGYAAEAIKNAQAAAERAADVALHVGQKYEPLTKAQRFLAVALGGVIGGMIMSAAITIFTILVRR
jgi:hypothetical protein